MTTQKRNISLGFTNEVFPAGTHMCYIFNDDEDRRELIASKSLGHEKH